jgi:hypothetical protein
MSKPNWKVTIAFDDPTVPCFAPVWEPAIRIVIEGLEKTGVKYPILACRKYHYFIDPAYTERTKPGTYLRC